MTILKPKVRRAHPFQWVVEPLAEDPSCQVKKFMENYRPGLEALAKRWPGCQPARLFRGVELLVVPLRVEEVDGTAAGSNNRARVVVAFPFKEFYRLIELLRGHLEGLMGDAILFKRVAA